MNHFVALFPTLSCSSPYFSTYTAAPGPPTCTGATGGGRTSPVSSEWDMISAPISLVLTPQDVAHTSSRSGDTEAGKDDTGYGTPSKYNHSRFASKLIPAYSRCKTSSHARTAWTLALEQIQRILSSASSNAFQELIYMLCSLPSFDKLLTFLLSLVVHVERSSEILTCTPHGTAQTKHTIDEMRSRDTNAVKQLTINRTTILYVAHSPP